MYISYHWLRELTATKLTPLELRERLTMVGLAIDAIATADDDHVLDVEVPSNRPDCLSHVGIAREVCVIESGTLTLPAAIPLQTADRAEALTSVQVLEPQLCPRYAARLVRGVKIGPSPGWLSKRLEAIGQRPINNVADITNYVLHELGQPLHAFDLSRLSEQRIVVRRARAGEKIITLDGVERALNPEMLVIADANRATAVAGVMGGQDSEISDATVDVLIESAYFDPDSVRRTARALGMDTEASRRFERGADYGGVIRALDRCVELICDIAGGVATENAIDVCHDLPRERRIDFRFARVAALTSLQVTESEMRRILKSLGFVSAGSAESGNAGGAETFVVPTWRPDVSLEEDLVEEIARHVGYDRIASELAPSNSAGEYHPRELKSRSLRRTLAALGYDEAINFSFIDTNHDELIAPIPEFINQDDEAFITLRNPTLENAVRMRPTLLPGLLEALRHNLNHGTKDVRLFEMGRIFAFRPGGELPEEREALALLASGGLSEEGRAQAPRELDWYDLKGALEAAIDATRIGPLSFEADNAKHLRPGQTAAINLKEKTIGSLGRLADSVAATYKFRQPVYVAELDLTGLFAGTERAVQYHPLARYPAVMRDITLLVPRDTMLNDLVQAISNEKILVCRATQLVGVYEGPNIPEDKRAITLRLEYRADDRTLRDNEVEESQQQIVDMLTQTFAAELH
jgi:phenylalanyl-tRNA synthetase beta chain